MADIEKVIKALECCIKDSEHIDDNPCFKCPYSCQCQEGYTSALKEDALKIIKWQQQKYWTLEYDWRRLKEQKLNGK